MSLLADHRDGIARITLAVALIGGAMALGLMTPERTSAPAMLETQNAADDCAGNSDNPTAIALACGSLAGPAQRVRNGSIQFLSAGERVQAGERTGRSQPQWGKFQRPPGRE